MIAYKLFNVRKDGTLGPLFINRRQRILTGKVLRARVNRTKGFAVRKGWHSCALPFAPHLTPKGRRWYRVDILGWTVHKRSEREGSLWYTSSHMQVLGPISAEEQKALLSGSKSDAPVSRL